VQVVEFLVDVGLAVIGAIEAFLGQVRAAVERVGEALTELTGWLLATVRSTFTALLSPVAEIFADLADKYFEAVGSSLAIAAYEVRGTGSVSDPTLGVVDRSLFGPLFLLLFGLASGLILASIIFAPYVFLFAAIASVLAIALVAVLWNQALNKKGIPPEGEIPNFPITANLSAVVESLDDLILGPEQSAQSVPASLSAKASHGLLSCRDSFALYGFLVQFSGWFLLLGVVGVFGEPSGVGAALGAVLFSMFGISFALIGSLSRDQEIAVLFTILGLIMSVLALISVTVLLGKPMIQVKPWGLAATVLFAGGFAISKGVTEVIC
jgi:hypothetical protein